MKIKARLLIAIIGALMAPGLTFSAVPAQPGEGEVLIVIRNSVFEFQGGAIRPDAQATIILQNMDTLRHGFSSPVLDRLEAEVEGPGGDVYGKGIRGIHIQPGETYYIRFTPTQPGKFSFRCDLHPKMRGELIMLSIGAV
ncbi:MAG TPA: hypothetical protein VI702_02910 [Nitrospiria bacterium]